MFRSNWSHSLFGMARSRKDRHRQAAQPQRQVRLMLEPLEDRITPSLAVNPHIPVSNAIAAEQPILDYLNQIFHSFPLSAGGQANTSTSGNGSSLPIAGQNGLIDALANLSQNIASLAQELSSANVPSNAAASLLSQQQLP